jgi:hypothetical protein
MDSYISTSFVRSPRLSDLLPHPGDVGSYIIRLGPIPHRLAAISPLPRSPGTPAAFFCSVSAGTESGDKCGVGSVDHGRPPQLAVSVVATTGRRLTSAVQSWQAPRAVTGCQYVPRRVHGRNCSRAGRMRQLRIRDGGGVQG